MVSTVNVAPICFKNVIDFSDEERTLTTLMGIETFLTVNIISVNKIMDILVLYLYVSNISFSSHWGLSSGPET